jgi:protein TonB
MSNEAMTSHAHLDHHETANDRFKRSFGNWFWGSMMAATVVHFLVFQLWPEMQAADFTFDMETMTAIELPPEVDIPPPPERIARPATPVISNAVIDEDITIALTTFEDNPVSELPPPPVQAAGVDLSAAPAFTPMTVRPQILNVPEVQREMQRQYPTILRDAGIGGTVQVDFFIDTNGRVGNAFVNTSSGHQQLDDAALRVAETYRFRPAQNRDQIVPVWVTFPITFRVTPRH